MHVDKTRAGGCYDVVGQQSLPAGDGLCDAGDPTILPAHELTREAVTEYIRGGRIDIFISDSGLKRVVVPAFDGPDIVITFLRNPHHESERNAEEPHQEGELNNNKNKNNKKPKKNKATVNRHQVPSESRGVTAEILIPLRPKKEENTVPAGVVATEVETRERLPHGSAVRLQPPQVSIRDKRDKLVGGSSGLQKTLNDISAAINRMNCSVAGCTCLHPPCIPCPLENFRVSGLSDEQWAANWIIWYSRDSSTSERTIAIRVLTREEERVLRWTKYRWGFAENIEEPISTFNWENGRIPSDYIDPKVMALLSRGGHGAKVELKNIPDEDIKGALSIVVDTAAPSSARIHAMRWLDKNGLVEGNVADVIKKIGMYDQDESVRAVALDIYESYKKNETRDLANGSHNP